MTQTEIPLQQTVKCSLQEIANFKKQSVLAHPAQSYGNRFAYVNITTTRYQLAQIMSTVP